MNHSLLRRSFLKSGVVGVGSVITGAGMATAASRSMHLGNSFDVKSFGAMGDGKALDTPSINKAIDAAAANGGGTVNFPSGSYLCYSIHLKSNVDLFLGRGATIVAADAPAAGSQGYDPPEPNQWDQYQDFGHSHFHNSLLWGEDIHDFSIIGPGRIWGRGLNRGSGDTALPAGVGNKSISLKNCHNVILRDFSILHGGHFGILATGVDNLTIDNLVIDTNRDGIDVDCCRNVRISNCTVNSPWDDAICPKSSFALGYARPVDNLTITNCYVTGGYQEGTVLDGTFKKIGPDDKAPKNGRIKCGTESNGGFRNVTITNCVLEDCHGIALESVDGAFLEDVTISNIAMRDINDVPFFVRLGARMRGPEGVPVGELRRVLISNVVCSNSASKQAALVTGIPGHYIEDLRFQNIYIQHRGGGTKEAATITPPENEKMYPDPNRFGPLPAHGFFVRHVKGLQMRDIEVVPMSVDLRPAFVLDDVVGADFAHIKPQMTDVSFALNNVADFSVVQSRPIPDTYLDKVTQKNL